VKGKIDGLASNRERFHGDHFPKRKFFSSVAVKVNIAKEHAASASWYGGGGRAF
jgi:hypothetical protein